MGQLDASIVTLALPTLREEFHATLGAIEWVTLAYLVVLVGAVTVVGRLADITGRKLLYIYGFGVFTIGSILCGVAPTLLFLDAARVLQAIGAALLQANSVALITHGVPRAKLGHAIGIQGGAQAVGLALGPAVGGGLIGLGGWRLMLALSCSAIRATVARRRPWPREPRRSPIGPSATPRCRGCPVRSCSLMLTWRTVRPTRPC